MGWGPTVRELDHLAGLFGELVHVAPVHAGDAPASELPYTAGNVRVVAVSPAGGTGWKEKLSVLRAVPQYLRAIRRELRDSDIVHVRCPSNIGLVASLLLAFRRRPAARWIKYAGNWSPAGRENVSYRLQRWILRRDLARGYVTVNGRWPNQPVHVRSFLNPCLTEQELRDGAAAAARKTLEPPVRLLFVGRLDEDKGCGRVLEILEELRRDGLDASLDAIGHGPDRDRFEARAARGGLAGAVRFHGWLPRAELASFYARAHFLLLPSSSSEGWPKVISEGMAYGVVPLTSNVSSIPQILGDFGVGQVRGARDREGFVALLRDYVRSPERWQAESRRAVEAARAFSYGAYQAAVRNLLGLEAA